MIYRSTTNGGYDSTAHSPLLRGVSAAAVGRQSAPLADRRPKAAASVEAMYVASPDSLRATRDLLNESWRVGEGIGPDSFHDEITKASHLDQEELVERDFQGGLLMPSMEKSFEADQAQLETLIRTVQSDLVSSMPSLNGKAGSYQFDGNFAADNVDLARSAVHTGVSTSTLASSLYYKSFLISFMVDARGGAMRGCRHSGVRVIVPPRKAPSPLRITCRYLRKEKLTHPPPISEGEALASRILEMGPSGAKFLGPVILEVPHFASLRNKEREIVILRSDDGEHWKEHQLEATEDAVQEVLNESFDPEELSQLDDLNTTRITRILTSDFPQYFAIVTRVRQEVHAVGSEGGVITSTVVPQVQALFPEGALTKTIRVSLQAHPIPPELVNKLFGNRVALSPIVTVEPRRRKFHKPINLCIPLPKSSQKTGSAATAAGPETPTLRLLCSITGGTAPAQWEDITGTTQLTFTAESVSFTTTVSARFWLMDCQATREASRMAQEIYSEAIVVPYMAKFVVFARRAYPKEGQLRVFCMTDDKEEKTLERQEHYKEIAKSRDVEVLAGRPSHLEFGGNLIPVMKSGDQLHLNFVPFTENRLMFSMRVKDSDDEETAAEGRIAFMKEPKVRPDNLPPQHPICTLAITLPEYTGKLSETGSEKELYSLERKYKHLKVPGLDTIHGSNVRAADVVRELGPNADWRQLAVELGVPDEDAAQIGRQYAEAEPADVVLLSPTLAVLRIWLEMCGPRATASLLDKALKRLERHDAAKKLFPLLQEAASQPPPLPRHQQHEFIVAREKPLNAEATTALPVAARASSQTMSIRLLNKDAPGLDDKLPASQLPHSDVLSPSVVVEEHIVQHIPTTQKIDQIKSADTGIMDIKPAILSGPVVSEECTLVRLEPGSSVVTVISEPVEHFAAPHELPGVVIDSDNREILKTTTVKRVVKEDARDPEGVVVTQTETKKVKVRPKDAITGSSVSKDTITQSTAKQEVLKSSLHKSEQIIPKQQYYAESLRLTKDNLLEPWPAKDASAAEEAVKFLEEYPASHEIRGVIVDTDDKEYLKTTTVKRVITGDTQDPEGAVVTKIETKKVKVRPKRPETTEQSRESKEEGFLDDRGNVVVSKKVTRIVTTTKTVFDSESSEPKTESVQSVEESKVGGSPSLITETSERLPLSKLVKHEDDEQVSRDKHLVTQGSDKSAERGPMTNAKEEFSHLASQLLLLGKSGLTHSSTEKADPCSSVSKSIISQDDHESSLSVHERIRLYEQLTSKSAVHPDRHRDIFSYHKETIAVGQQESESYTEPLAENVRNMPTDVQSEYITPISPKLDEIAIIKASDESIDERDYIKESDSFEMDEDTYEKYQTNDYITMQDFSEKLSILIILDAFAELSSSIQSAHGALIRLSSTDTRDSVGVHISVVPPSEIPEINTTLPDSNIQIYASPLEPSPLTSDVTINDLHDSSSSQSPFEAYYFRTQSQTSSVDREILNGSSSADQSIPQTSLCRENLTSLEQKPTLSASSTQETDYASALSHIPSSTSQSYVTAQSSMSETSLAGRAELTGSESETLVGSHRDVDHDDYDDYSYEDDSSITHESQPKESHILQGSFLQKGPVESDRLFTVMAEKDDVPYQVVEEEQPPLSDTGDELEKISELSESIKDIGSPDDKQLSSFMDLERQYSCKLQEMDDSEAAALAHGTPHFETESHYTAMEIIPFKRDEALVHFTSPLEDTVITQSMVSKSKDLESACSSRSVESSESTIVLPDSVSVDSLFLKQLSTDLVDEVLSQPETKIENCVDEAKFESYPLYLQTSGLTLSTIDSETLFRQINLDTVVEESEMESSVESSKFVHASKKAKCSSIDNMSEGSLQEFERIERELYLRGGESSLSNSELELLKQGIAMNTDDSLNSMNNLEDNNFVTYHFTKNGGSQRKLEDVMQLSDICEEFETDETQRFAPVLEPTKILELEDNPFDESGSEIEPSKLSDTSDGQKSNTQPFLESSLTGVEKSLDKERFTQTQFESFSSSEHENPLHVIRSVITKITDPVEQTVRFSGIDSKEQFLQYIQDLQSTSQQSEEFESTDEYGNVTKTSIRKL